MFVCIRGQRRSLAPGTVHYMQLTTLKAILATVWISAVLLAGVAGHPDSVPRWALLVGFAVFPPIVMVWRLNFPAQTISESIQTARR